jgi:hypothetical protein
MHQALANEHDLLVNMVLKKCSKQGKHIINCNRTSYLLVISEHSPPALTHITDALCRPFKVCLYLKYNSL